MTAYTQRLICVVTADLQAGANVHGKTVDPVGGEQAFTVPLSGTGMVPATHYWCDWALRPSDRTLLSTLLMSLPLATLKVNIYELDDADPGRGVPSPTTVLQTLGLKPVMTVTQV